MQTDKDRWIASMRKEIDAMNKAFYATYAKEELAAQYPEPRSDYDHLLEVCQGWDDEAFEEDTVDDIATCLSAGDETLARLLREAEDADKRVAAHCRKKLAERAKPSAADQFRSLMSVGADSDTSYTTIRDYLQRQDAEFHAHAKAWEDVVVKTAVAALIPTAERTCSTCSKTCDVGVKCWWCGELG